VLLARIGDTEMSKENISNNEHELDKKIDASTRRMLDRQAKHDSLIEKGIMTREQADKETEMMLDHIEVAKKLEAILDG
jgi:hypothetical protein